MKRSVYDSDSSHSDGESSWQVMLQKISNSPYKWSIVLTSLGNDLLRGAYKEFTGINKECDPLVFAHKLCKKRIRQITSALKDDTVDGNTRIEDQLELESFNKEVSYITSLIQSRDHLNLHLRYAMPFTKRNLSATFVNNYNSFFDKDQPEDTIIKILNTNRNNIVSGKFLPTLENNKLLEFFGIEIKTIRNDTKYSKQNVLDKFSKKLESLLGPRASIQETEKCKTHLVKNEIIDSKFNNEEVENYIRSFINDSQDSIISTMRAIRNYSCKYEYIDYIQQQHFLAQVAVYRYICRDLQKTLKVCCFPELVKTYH